MKRLEKRLPSKASFSSFLQLNSSNFRLKQCERPTKIVKEIKFEGVQGELKLKKRFPETIIHKIFETNSSFHVK